jgi:hypothetical protein
MEITVALLLSYNVVTSSELCGRSYRRIPRGLRYQTGARHCAHASRPRFLQKHRDEKFVVLILSAVIGVQVENELRVRDVPLQEALPGVPIIERSSVNAFHDPTAARAINATGRTKT